MTLASVATIAVLGACNYGFRGGGFPEHIRTIHIETFDNRTPQFDLEQQMYTAMVDRLPSALGIRVGSQTNADAVLSGTINGYDDVAQNYAGGDGGRVQVLQHQVRVSMQARLVDVRENVILWEGRVTGTGRYAPGTETEDEGRREAIEDIVTEIVDGAMSQW